jgi:hypothetical protein
MSDILTWTWHGDEFAVSSGGGRVYTVMTTCAYGPDRYPWLLLPPYNDQKHVTHHTNAGRAMDAAELRESRPAMFLATVGALTLAQAQAAEQQPDQLIDMAAQVEEP